MLKCSLNFKMYHMWDNFKLGQFDIIWSSSVSIFPAALNTQKEVKNKVIISFDNNII